MNGNVGDPTVNPTLFGRIGSFSGSVLSIYGDQDPFYTIEHSKTNVAEIAARNPNSEMQVVKLPGYGNGHWALSVPNLWEDKVEAFLRKSGNTP